jgi:predicted oxidoreductase
MSEPNYQAEVAIVGGGIAGIVAAIELLDAGKRVILLDRDEESALGGLANWSFGGMFFVDTPVQRRMGIRDSIDLATRDWYAFAEFDPQEHWGRVWADQFIHLTTPHGYRWLKSRGISFFPVVNWAERGLFTPGNSVPRFHLLWGTGYALAQTMIGHLLGHRNRNLLQLLCRHRVLEIETAANTITGVSGVRESDDTPFTVRADVVVIASGGLGGNIERVKQDWHRDWGTPPETILNGSHEYAMGDLHDATERTGGNVVNLDKQWNYAAGVHAPQPRMPNHGLSLVPAKSALWLNHRGERFKPIPLITAFDTRYLVERICQEEVKYTWQILNMKIAKKEFAISGSEHNTAIRDKKLFQFLKTMLLGNKPLVDDMLANCKDFVIADSLDQLVTRMNAIDDNGHVDAEVLKDAVNAYDANIDRGPKYHNDDQLRRIAHARQYRGDRIRTCKFQKIDDPRARPLIAIRTFILSRKSLGGIQTDLQSRVLTKPNSESSGFESSGPAQQRPIEGLYAVGEAAGFGGGGMHGLRSLEGTFLGGCVISARIAAHSILGKQLRD